MATRLQRVHQRIAMLVIVRRWVEERGVNFNRFWKSRHGQAGQMRIVFAQELRMRWKENGLEFRPSYPEIAAAIGLRTHSTVIEAVKKKGGAK